MLLVVHEPPGHEARVVATNPDAAEIATTIKTMPWSDLTFVVLRTDENNWIEGSGSLKPEDGLSARYMVNGEEHVAAQAPSSLDELVALLQSYSKGDGRWQQLIEWR